MVCEALKDAEHELALLAVYVAGVVDGKRAERLRLCERHALLVDAAADVAKDERAMARFFKGDA